MKIALLTGGKDEHYVRGLVRELSHRGVVVFAAGATERVILLRIVMNRDQRI